MVFMRTGLHTQELMEKFWNAGIPAYQLGSAREYYHETRTLPSTINSISGDGYIIPDKPMGALWLSSGLETDEGKVVTDWRTFMVSDMDAKARDLKTYSTHRAIFSPESIYIILTEENWAHLPQVWNPQAAPYKLPLRGRFSFSLEETPHVPWLRLLDLGVAAVAIDGRDQRDHFYGYDVDSLVVISDSAIEDWEQVVSEEDLWLIYNYEW